MQRRNENDAVAHGALFHRGFHLRSDVEDLAQLGRLNGDLLVVDFQASASRIGATVAKALWIVQSGRSEKRNYPLWQVEQCFASI